MKKEDVPQDQGNLSKSNIKELVYATDDKGNYTTALSSGWEPKTIALNLSMDEIHERVEVAKQLVLDQKASPILYYMELNKMDISILASYVGLWGWQIKRHFKPEKFNKLSAKVLHKYAEAFNISVEQLKTVNTL